jgi:CHAD domain-containing protein
MAYRLKRDESVPAGLRRIAGEELDDAARQLTQSKPAKRDEDIHEARKSIKKVRAILRLMREELDGDYARDNAQLRDTGRKLSELRDAGAIIGTFDALTAKYKDEVGNGSLASIRRALETRKQETERRANVVQVMREAAESIEKIAKGVRKWPLRTDGFPAIRPGLEEAFRRGRRGLARAQKLPRPEAYHEWRKRVKDNWYHVRLLEDLWTDVMRANEKSLKELETWLGEDHNLVVLSDQVAADPAAFGKDKEIDLFLSLTGKYQKELREKAESLGQRIYEEKPREYIRRMNQLWDAWQTEPESLEEQWKQERAADA